MMLNEYRKAVLAVCKAKHCKTSDCICLGLASVADKIIKVGYVKLKPTFVCVSQHVQPCEACFCNTESNPAVPVMRKEPLNEIKNYTSFHAKRLFLQMPVASVLIGKGRSDNFEYKYADITFAK